MKGLPENLPGVEKTNITQWPFDELVLTDVVEASFDLSSLHLTDNSIVIVDGTVVHQEVLEGITVEFTIDETLSAEHHRLLAINNRMTNSGIKVTVAENAAPASPLSVFIISKERSLVHQTMLELKTGANLNYTETYLAQAALNANIVNRIIVGDHAHLKANIISDMYAGTTVFHNKFSEVFGTGVLDMTNFIINDANMLFEDYAHLEGKGSETTLKTVSIADGKQQQNITTQLENYSPRSTANIINYGIVKDDAHLAFKGVGKIHKGMNASDNQQETRLLNLSKTAEAIANPFLLIDEGDITAGHAATIGQLDEEQIYYLMSRGMSREAASKMIVSGFLTPFVDEIDDEVMREVLMKKIEAKLG